jgi:transposase InsO family protein
VWRRRFRAEEAAWRGSQGSTHRRLGRKAGHQERSHRRTHGGERQGKKSQWGTLNGNWVPHDTRDQVVDYVNRWSERSELPAKRLLEWLEVREGKYYDWTKRYGKANEHNAQVPRDFWLEEAEKQAILDFHRQHPLDGYRRLTYMMLDADVAAVSAATVYRVLSQAGRLGRNWAKPSKKGTGFVQPLKAHEHWHIDISYLNIAGTFYFLISILDGYSRFIVDWDIFPNMYEESVEIVVQRAKEKFPHACPRIISDNGGQFIARDFKELVRLLGMTHVRTSPGHPQSNGKLERWHGTIKSECIRPGTPLCLEDAQRLVSRWIYEYNQVRLHSALGYVTPADKLAGREIAIYAQRDQKLEAAREQRQAKRQAARAATVAQPALAS